MAIDDDEKAQLINRDNENVRTVFSSMIFHPKQWEKKKRKVEGREGLRTTRRDNLLPTFNPGILIGGESRRVYRIQRAV